MKFKEFVEWCNERACDGYWSMGTAIYCCELVSNIYKFRRRHREKAWEEINEREKIVEDIVNPINQKIAKLVGDMG